MARTPEVYTGRRLKKALPQKGDSRFIESATVFPGKSAIATLRKLPILIKSGKRTVPHLVIFDGMAQALTMINPPKGEEVGLFAGIDKMTISRMPEVSEINQVVFEAEVLKQKGNVGKAHVATRVGKTVLVEADYLFALSNSEALKSNQ